MSRYGVIKPKQAGNRIYQVMSLVEKPELAEAPSDLAMMGRYVLMPEILDVLKDTAPSRKGEIQLTDALRRLLKAQPVHGYEFEGERYDAGTPLGWLETTIALALKDPDNGSRLRDYLAALAETFDLYATIRPDTSLDGYHCDLSANISLEMEGDKPGAYDMVFSPSRGGYRG